MGYDPIHKFRSQSKEMLQEKSRKRSARISAARALGTHTQAEWMALRDVCFNRCVKCKDAGDWNLVKDHILPIYAGGSDAIDNIQPLCQRCNNAKSAGPVDYRPENWKFLLPTFLEQEE